MSETLPLMEGERAEREMVRESDGAQVGEWERLDLSLNGTDTKSMCGGCVEGQSCFARGIGAVIWGKIDSGHMAAKPRTAPLRPLGPGVLTDGGSVGKRYTKPSPGLSGRESIHFSAAKALGSVM